MRVVSKATLFAMIFALTWPPSLTAAADATSLLLLTSVIGQRSVLDRDEEEPPPPEQPAEAEPEEKEEVVAPAKTEQLPEPAEEEMEAEQPPAETEEEEEPEQQEKPPGKPPRRPRARGTASLDTPAEEQAPKEETSRKADVHDVLYWRVDRDEIREMPIVLCPEYLPIPVPPERLAEEFEFQRWTTSGTATHSIQGTQIVRISYYENRVGTQAARELGLPSFELLTEPGRVVDLSERPQSYDEAEKLLRNALAEHDSAVQRRLRKGTIWKEKLREPLVQALVNLELGRVDQLIGQQLYQQAQAECERLAGEFGDAATQSAELRRRYDQILEARAERALGQDDYATVRELLDQMASRFNGQLGGAGARFRQRLVDQASELVRQAQQLRETQPQQALERLDEAARIWPALPGLDDQRRRLVGDYPILHCAYPELPRSLSPLEARMPVERHAVSLIYESLVTWVDHPRSGSHYECRLAEGRPIPIERGRAFYLPRCTWSDADVRRVPCTVEDVRWTVKLLNFSDRPGYSPALARLLGDVQNSPDNDPRVALVRLNRDHWQPLSLMDFSVVQHPDLSRQHELREELDRLRRSPVGTGPYRYAPDEDPDTRRFVANPYYRAAGRPGIREIVFHRLEPTNAVDLFMQGKIHLMYGVRPEHAIQLRDQGKQVICLKTPTVWFLAPNYRHRPLSNRNLRLAIAHAIRREEILETYFRIRPGTRDHVVLTGPYPADSWAYNREVSIYNPHDDEQKRTEQNTAKALAELARRELEPAQLTLRLVYPAESKEIQQACEQIKTHVGEVGIAIQLVPVPRSTFYQRVVDEHDFDLAYWRHDFEDPAYWLEPLLDQDAEARRLGGPNFMGYTQDTVIAGLFSRVNLHKHFPEIQEATVRLHEHVARNAILIPLWQLGTYVAVAPGVRPKDGDGNAIALDPFNLFTGVEHWELKASQ